MSYASYLEKVMTFKNRVKTLKSAKKVIKKKIGMKFDTIAVTGVSGLVFGTVLAHELKKNLCVVRKQDGSHSHLKVESGQSGQGRYIIVDDLIESGNTIRRINSEIQSSDGKDCPNPSVCVGIYLYNEGWLTPNDLFPPLTTPFG
jgi:orotate phosphoribosyltransferase